MNILVLLALVVLALWYFRGTSKYSGNQSEVAVPETIIQDLATAVRRKDMDLFPVETIYINKNPDGSLSARMLFINMRGFFGIQYDILGSISNGKVDIISMSQTIGPGLDGPFRPFKPDVYTPYPDIKSAVLSTLKGINQ
jgi:hypothetical protein